MDGGVRYAYDRIAQSRIKLVVSSFLLIDILFSFLSFLCPSLPLSLLFSFLSFLLPSLSPYRHTDGVHRLFSRNELQKEEAMLSQTLATRVGRNGDVLREQGETRKPEEGRRCKVGREEEARWDTFTSQAQVRTNLSSFPPSFPPCLPKELETGRRPSFPRSPLGPRS